MFTAVPEVHVTPRIQSKRPGEDATMYCHVAGEPFPKVNFLFVFVVLIQYFLEWNVKNVVRKKIKITFYVRFGFKPNYTPSLFVGILTLRELQ